MKRINRLFAALIVTLLIPSAIASAQDIKNEKQIKIVIAGDDGTKVILDTLITGNSVNDSIVLKDGHTIYLAKEGSDDAPGAKGSTKYIITSDATAGNDDRKHVNKEITIISSDSDMADQKAMDKSSQVNCESLVNEKKYTYTIESETSDADSERAKYVIARDGLVITVEGSDYTKVKEIIKDIEKTLDTKSEVRQNP
jgi:putative cell wall-binding protein